MQTPPKSGKAPSPPPEEKPALQFLQDSESDITLKIDDIHSLRDYVKDLPVTVMRAINATHLESLVHSDRNSWPPIYVALTSVGYICFDGYHRMQACRVLQVETIKARSIPVKHMNDLIEARFRANLKHGLPASEKTRSEYCYWLFLTYPSLSQREIAVRVGVAQSTVSRALERRQKEPQESVTGSTQSLEQVGETKETTQALTQREETKEKQAQEFTRATSRYLRLTIGFLKTVKAEEYEDLVWNLQGELLDGPEDRQALLRTGQLLLDIAKARRKTKTPEAVAQEIK